MRRGLFVTGTDTGVGKTAVSCGILRLLARRGGAPVPFKPVETGAAPTPYDALRLLAASGAILPLAHVCPFPLPSPVAPALAAHRVGLRLSLGELAAAAPRGDFLLVEGAGGLLTPYTWTETAADLAALLALPVLLVARNALGTVNHAALALAELRRRGLPFAGLILSTPNATATPDQPDNALLIERLTGVRALATLPFVNPPDPDAIADILAPVVPPERLLRDAQPLPP